MPYQEGDEKGLRIGGDLMTKSSDAAWLPQDRQSIWIEDRLTLDFTRHETARYSVIDARNWDIRRFNARSHRPAPTALKMVIITENVKRRFRNVSCVRDCMSGSAGTAEYSTLSVMPRTLQIQHSN